MTTVPTPSDSQDGARRRDDAEPLSLDQAVDKIKKLGETILWFDQQRELLFAQVNGLRADVARLEAERDEARAAALRMRQARNEAQAQCRALGPLVEAVLRFAEVEAGRTPTMENSSVWLEELNVRRAALLAAVDQSTPSSPLETRQAADGGEAGVVAGAGGSEAAEGRMDCPERCEVPAGVRIVETPPSRHAWSDVVRCPNNGCEKTFLVILDA